MLEWWNDLVDAERVLLLVAVISLGILFFYYFFFFLRLAFYKAPSPENSELPPLSVIICARNEAENIITYLPKILQQDYPEFEVIVVNDNSWDGTGDELAELQKTHIHLQVVSIGEHVQHLPGKKFPLTLGIKKAKFRHLVFTDADCFPSGDKWLQYLGSSFSGGKEIVLAPGPYQASKGLLNAMIRFDALTTGGMFLSFALAGLPYMGIGRNLAYTRDVYDRTGGFKKHYHIMSGDDDLFVQAAATGKNTAACIHSDALMMTPAKTTWSQWRIQKSRHFSTAPHYRIGFKILLTLYPLCVFLFFVAAIALLVYENTRHISLLVIGIKLLVQIAIFRLVFKVQKDRLLWLLAPLMEVLLLGNQVVVMLVGGISNKRRWK